MDITSALQAPALGGSAGGATQHVQMSYGGSLTSDVAAFEGSLDKAAQARDASVTEVARAVFEPLDYINTEAASLAEFAQAAVQDDKVLSPSEIVSLTVRSQEFMFHSQLTANIANRTSDGIQQLFRQQG